MNPLFLLLVLALATFSTAYMITHESGPMFVFWKLRKAAKKDKDSSLAEGIQCPYCVSAWVAIAVAAHVFLYDWEWDWLRSAVDFVIAFQALRGAAILLHQCFVWLKRE